MKITPIVIHVLIFLPAIIAWARHCQYRFVILLICGLIAGVSIYDLHDILATRNARHSMILFAAEVLLWLPVFILSIYARTTRSPVADG